MYLTREKLFLGFYDKWINFYNISVRNEIWVDYNYKLITDISQLDQKYKTIPFHIITREDYNCNYGEESDKCNCFLFLLKEGERVIDVTAFFAICDGEKMAIYQ